MSAVCPECGKEISAGSPICLGCGFPLDLGDGVSSESQVGEMVAESLMGEESEGASSQNIESPTECSECGRRVTAGFAFCPHCGCSLDGGRGDSDMAQDREKPMGEGHQSVLAGGDGVSQPVEKKRIGGGIGAMIALSVIAITLVLIIVSTAFGRMDASNEDEKTSESGGNSVTIGLYLEDLGEILPSKNAPVVMEDVEYNNVNKVPVAGILGSIEQYQGVGYGSADSLNKSFYYIDKVVWTSNYSNYKQKDFDAVVHEIAGMYKVDEDNLPTGLTSVEFANDLCSEIECRIEGGSISVTWNYDGDNYQGIAKKPNVSPGETKILKE